MLAPAAGHSCDSIDSHHTDTQTDAHIDVMQSYPLPATQFLELTPTMKLAYSVVPAAAGVEFKRCPTVLISQSRMTNTKDTIACTAVRLIVCAEICPDHRLSGPQSVGPV
jgi:hypothetical protein